MSNRRAHAQLNEAGGARPQPVCLLVLGMHRSGTSALTRVASLLGADLPANLMSGTHAHHASNAKGHWESEPIVRLNDHIFESAGISWRSPEAMPHDWYQSVRFHQFREQAQRLIESEYGKSPLFVLKDPRLCKLVPFWLAVLEAAGIRPAPVNMFRSPAEVAESLFKRNALDRPLGVLMWLRYVLASERDSRGMARVHLSYDGLMADWQAGVKAIADQFQIRWPSASTARVEQISDYLSESERHHRKPVDVSARGDVDSWANESCAIFSRWVQHGETPADHARLDAIASQFDQALRPLLPPLLVSYEKSASAQKLQVIRASQAAELEQLKARLQQAEGPDGALAALAERNAALASEIGQLQFKHDQARQEWELRESRLIELLNLEKERLQDLEGQLAQVRRVNSTLLIVRGRFEAASEQIAQLNADHRAISQRLSAAEQLLANERKDSADRAADLKKKLELAQQLAETREQTIIRLREDRSSKIEQRDRLQAAAIAIREDRALQIQRREERIRQRDEQNRELARSVKRLERKIETLRQREQERDAEVPPVAIFDRAKRPSAFASLLERIVPRLRQERVRTSIDLVRASGLFDADYYRKRYPDLQGNDDELLEHFVRHGGFEGRFPSAAFNVVKYVQRYPDVAAAGLNPLLHFLEQGRNEGRIADPVGAPRKVGAPEAPVEAAPVEAGALAVPVVEPAEVELPDPPEAETESPPALDLAEGEDRADEADAERAPDESIPEPAMPGSAPAEQSLKESESFAAMAVGASDWVTSSELPDNGAVTAGGVAVAIENPSAADDAYAALRWFEALNSTSASDVACDPEAAIRTALDGDRLVIDDAWLSGDFRVQVRLSARSPEALVLRCWQRGEQGAVSLCAEQSLGGEQSHVLDIALASRFDPLLMVISDRRGRLIDSTLLPFPTLLRGGLHHGELIDSSDAAGGWAAHGPYASHLLAAAATQSGNLAIREVKVALAGANGTEAIFSGGFQHWLGRRFNVAVTTDVAPDDNPALMVLAEQMRRLQPSADFPSRRSGRTLAIDATSIPSLSILLAREEDLFEASAARTILTDELSRRPLRAVDQPLADDAASLVHQFLVPPLPPGRSTGRPETIVSISFRGEQVRDVRQAFPIAADLSTFVPALAGSNSHPLTAIIDCSGDVAALRGLLASLSTQQGIAALECLLIGAVPDVEDLLLLPFGSDQRLTLTRTGIEGGSQISRIDAAVARAAHDSVLLLDDAKTLHDPRTVCVLQALCAGDEIGTAACRTVSEKMSKSGVPSYDAFGGFVPTRRGASVGIARLDAGTLPSAPFYPLLANPIDCLMIKRADWPFAANEIDCAGRPEAAIALGRALIERGKLNIATSTIAVTDANEAEAATVEAPWLATTPTRFIAVEEY